MRAPAPTRHRFRRLPPRPDASAAPLGPADEAGQHGPTGAAAPAPGASDEPAGARSTTLAGTGDTRTPTVGTVAWLLVLAAVAGVQLGRHAWPDSIALLAVLGVLVVDLTGRLRHGEVAVAHTGPAVIGSAALVGLVLVAAPRHGTVAGLTVVAAGAAAIAYAWPDRRDDERVADDRPVWDRPTSRTALAWSAAWIAACLWELAMFVLGSRETDGRNRYPAASDLLDPVLDHPLAKALFVVGWLAAGVGLLARTDRR